METRRRNLAVVAGLVTAVYAGSGIVWSSQPSGIDRLGIAVVIQGVGAADSAHLKGAVESAVRQRLQTFTVVTGEEAESLRQPLLKTTLSIQELRECPEVALTFLRIGLLTSNVRDSLPRHLLGERLTIWEREVWGVASARNPWSTSKSNLDLYLGDFAMNVGLANVATKQMAAVSVSPPQFAQGPTERGEEDEPRIGLDVKFAAEAVDKSFHYESAEDHWSGMKSGAELRAREYLERAGFAVGVRDELTSLHDQVLTVFIKLFELEECPHRVVAVLQVELGLNVNPGHAAEQVLLGRRAAWVWEETKPFEIRDGKVRIVVEEGLEELLGGFVQRLDGTGSVD